MLLIQEHVLRQKTCFFFFNNLQYYFPTLLLLKSYRSVIVIRFGMYVTEIDENLIMLDCIYKNVHTLKYHIVNIYILYISGVGLWTMT